MKLKTSNPTVLAVAKYYGFTSHGKFADWLHSMCPNSKLFFIENGIKSFIRVSRVRHLYFHAY